MITLIETDHESETFYTREIDADAVGTNDSQFVMLGTPTDAEIRNYANDNLAAPESGDFDGWGVEHSNLGS
jgi:hypothetical protein